MNIEMEIEKKARELNKFKRKVFILQFISRSRKSVSQECGELAGQNQSTTDGKSDTI